MTTIANVRAGVEKNFGAARGRVGLGLEKLLEEGHITQADSAAVVSAYLSALEVGLERHPGQRHNLLAEESLT